MSTGQKAEDFEVPISEADIVRAKEENARLLGVGVLNLPSQPPEVFEQQVDFCRRLFHRLAPEILGPQRAEAEVAATSVRIKTSVAIELAVRQGVEDSLTEWEAQFLSEPLPESALPSRQRDEIINRVTDAVTMSIANLIDFGEDE